MNKDDQIKGMSQLNRGSVGFQEALAKQEQGEPVACIHRNEYNEYRLEPHDNFDIKSIPFNVDVPLFKGSPAQKPLTDEQIDNAIRDDGDILLDHIYEYGTAAEGVTERLRAIARAAINASHGIKE